jgi:thiol-disulfide isomerase/thioredoxin
MSFVARLGLAITHPRWALTIAGDRKQAGRSGSDLIALIALVLVATQLRGLFAAAWLGRAVSPGLGLRAAMHVLTRSLTLQLGFLVLAAGVLFVAAGRKRNLGRAFDLACVAVLPVVLVELLATVVVRAAEIEVPWRLSVELALFSCAWAGTLIALGLRAARSTAAAIPDPPANEVMRARRAGWVVLGVVLIGAAVQVAFIVNHSEAMRPMTQGDEAPSFALPAIGPKGVLGAPVTLEASRGKVTVVDFWATWCGPCLRAMPALDALAVQHPEVTILAVNLDDAVEARALFDERGYRLTLVADDGQVSERYGVTTIPHSVVIDTGGVVRLVHRGGGTNVEQEVTKMLAEQIRK